MVRCRPRSTANQGLSAEQQRRSYTLDIEFRLMAGKWLGAAARSDSSVLVLKQARSLEPEPRGMAASLFDEPMARDLLMRVRRIDGYRCHGNRLAIEFLSLFTDVKSVPDMGYRDKPYTAWVKLEGKGRDPERWLNSDFLRLERPKPRGVGSFRLWGKLNPKIVAGTHWQSIEISLDRVTLIRDDGLSVSEAVECSRRVLHDTADAHLLDLIEE